MMRLPPTKDAIKEWKEHPERLCNFIEGLIKAAKFDMEEPFWFSYKDGVITLTGAVQKTQTNNEPFHFGILENHIGGQTMKPEDAIKIPGLPSDCVYCDYLEDGACTDEYMNRLCYPHLEGTEPKSNNQALSSSNNTKGE